MLFAFIFIISGWWKYLWFFTKVALYKCCYQKLKEMIWLYLAFLASNEMQEFLIWRAERVDQEVSCCFYSHTIAKLAKMVFLWQPFFKTFLSLLLKVSQMFPFSLHWPPPLHSQPLPRPSLHYYLAMGYVYKLISSLLNLSQHPSNLLSLGCSPHWNESWNWCKGVYLLFYLIRGQTW